MQILFAITSSPLSWTGPHTFSIIAFSLGGLISLDFITTFPWLVEAVVMLGPAGLLRELPAEYKAITNATQALDQSDPRMRKIVEEILGVNPGCPLRKAAQEEQEVSKYAPAENTHPDASLPTSSDLDMGALLQWQYEFNQGHIYAFYDTVRHCPLMNSEFLWRDFCKLLTEENPSQPPSKLSESSLLVIFGGEDQVVVGQETKEDILKFVPRERVHFMTVPGGHGFVYPNSDAITEAIADHWGLKHPQ